METRVIGEDPLTEVLDNVHGTVTLNSGERRGYGGCLGCVVGHHGARLCACDTEGSLLPPPPAAGHTIPSIGLGVYQCTPGAEAYNAVRSALALGYRHIDTAQAYHNEEDVGRYGGVLRGANCWRADAPRDVAK